jgi:hypothetical protein
VALSPAHTVVLLGAGAVAGAINSLPKNNSPELSNKLAEFSPTVCEEIEPILCVEEMELSSFTAPSEIPENKSKAMNTRNLPIGKTSRKAFFTTLLTTIYVV